MRISESFFEALKATAIMSITFVVSLALAYGFLLGGGFLYPFMGVWGYIVLFVTIVFLFSFVVSLLLS